jgi:DNA-binding MarR family transcriptional regulator/GNAT superfamily N-acetyltransferase
MDTIDRIRSFNRFYTRQLGLLDESLDGSGFTLTEARILFELAQRAGNSASDLSRDLGLDGGYLSRILATFEADGIIRRKPSRTDGRRSTLELTPAGRKTFTPLRRAARDHVKQLITPLDRVQRDELLRSLTTVRTLLDDPDTATAPIRLQDPEPGDLGWVIHRQAALYHHEHGWDETYESLIARILADFVDAYDPTRDQARIAEQEGRIVGSVFLVRTDDPKVGQLRLLYVEPSTRGQGLGRRLVDECIAGARQRGYRTLRLWTNDVLVSARRIYEAAGFELVATEAHHSFGHHLVGQTWELPLS